MKKQVNFTGHLGIIMENKNVTRKTKKIIQNIFLFLIIFSCFSFYSGNISAQNTNIFTYVSNPNLNDQQRHYADAWFKGSAVISHFFVLVDTSLFRDNFLSINLPENKNILVTKRAINNLTGMYSWLGNINEIRGNADFVVHGEMVTGLISSDKFIYSLYPITGGLHVLVQTGATGRDESVQDYQQSLKRGIQHRSNPGIMHQDAETSGQQMLTAFCKVRILVAFTATAASNMADPIAFVNSCINATNTAYTNSSINFQVELACAIAVTYTEQLDASLDLDRFQDPADAFMDNIHSYRTVFDADMCVLIEEDIGPDLCGLAYTVDNAPFSDAFCVCRRDCAVGNFSFPHELGHLYGCRHDTYVDGGSSPYPDAHGYVYLLDLWRTIMAYNDYCDDIGLNCTRIQWFSNPGVFYNSVVTGLSGINDNESAMESSMSNISSLETTVINKVLSTAYTFVSGEQSDVLAGNSVYNSVPYIYKTGSVGTWRAGTYMDIKPGFWAKSGSSFNAFIDDCTTLLAPPEIDSKETSLSLLNPDSGFVIIPNPIINAFKIQYFLKNAGVVKIDLFDITGRKIKNLFSQILENSGQYLFSFEADDLQPGIYMCVIKAAEQTKTARLLKLE